jgi:protein-S-isoprenylcysteine O-methyltransferase Ste14
MSMSFLNIWVLTLFALFYIVFIGRSVMLYRHFSINPFVLGKGKRGPQRLVEVLFFIGLLYWTWETLNVAAAFGHRILPGFFYQQAPFPVIIKAAGCGLLLLGFVLFGWALFSLGSSWRIGIDRHTPGGLITSGAFAISRNPIFVAVDCYFLGVALIYGNLLFGLLFLIAAGGIHYQILQEERFLAERYECQYVEYRNKVRRYF